MSDTYRIKPLEWVVEETMAHAKTIIGDFYVYRSRIEHAYGDQVNCYTCDSLADGKAKAEAFYRQRLLPALEVVERKEESPA